MTKAEKMRALIRRELERSLIPGLQKAINENSLYVRKLKQYPKFFEGVIEELVELQLPYYMMADDQVAEKAFEFFMTPEGAAWCDMCGRFNDKLSLILPPFVNGVIRRLDALTLN